VSKSKKSITFISNNLDRIEVEVRSQNQSLNQMPTFHNIKNNQKQTAEQTWKIKLLFDGACPLCVREVNFLKQKDGNRGLVGFVDIAANDYDPAQNANIDFEAAMGRIHAILPNGEIVQNVEVFRQVYDILGIGWIYAITKIPIVGNVVDALYAVWADYRLFLTGRTNLKTVIAKRQQTLQGRGICASGCGIDDRISP
jgi:predicted DCC family thiol-disulfide oxidoreductase YuxK